MSMETQHHHTIRAALMRHLETRTHNDFDIIAVGRLTLYVPPALYPTLDVLTCGDLVEAAYDRDCCVVSLRRVS